MLRTLSLINRCFNYSFDEPNGFTKFDQFLLHFNENQKLDYHLCCLIVVFLIRFDHFLQQDDARSMDVWITL